MNALVVVTLLMGAGGMTPEQEVEAWQPFTPGDPADAPQHESGIGARTAASVIAPIVAVGGGLASAVVGGIGSTLAAGNNTSVVYPAAAVAGLAAFETILAIGLVIGLPAALPAWTIPVAVMAANLGAATGLALGLAASFAYVGTVYAGVDCVCGQDLLLLPAVVIGLTAAGATAGTVITTTVAAGE